MYVAISVPVGHSLPHALQDRQRSSASATAGESHAVVTRSPETISWSTRARPLVECSSSLVAWNDGHMIPPFAAESARHLPTPVHRWTAEANPSDSSGYAIAS